LTTLGAANRKERRMPNSRAAPDSANAEVDRRLFENARQFLQQWLEQRAPDAYLTHDWERFHAAYSQILRGMAARFRLAPEECDDVLQEVWSEVCARLPQLDWHRCGSGSGLRAWLYTLVRNKSIDCIRKRVRHRVETAVHVNALALVDPRPGPADQWDHPWDWELLRLLVGELQDEISAENLRFLTLRLLEGRSLAEAAKALTLPKERVKHRQKYLLRKLRGKLRLYRGEPLQPAGSGPQS
jgi:RNA polymerase sigma factor (sigma-70 family)